MSVSVRSFLIPPLLIPTVAVAGAVAVVPPLTDSPGGPLARQVGPPVVQVAEVQLAGIGRDIYDEITVFVQYTVSSAQFWIDLIPVIGPPLAEQLGINYFQLIQPVIASTVYYLSDLIENPLAFVQLTADYGANLFYAGYNWVSDQAQFLGLGPLPPIPAPGPLAAVGDTAAAPAAARVRSVGTAGAGAAESARAAAVAEGTDGTEGTGAAERTRAAAPAGRTPPPAAADAGRPARDSARAARQIVGAAAAETAGARESAPAAPPRSQTRKAAAAARGPVGTPPAGPAAAN